MRGSERLERVECRCGHAYDAHQHLRPGSDCALCPGTCARFRVRLRSLLERRDEGRPTD